MNGLLILGLVIALGTVCGALFSVVMNTKTGEKIADDIYKAFGFTDDDFEI